MSMSSDDEAMFAEELAMAYTPDPMSPEGLKRLQDNLEEMEANDPHLKELGERAEEAARKLYASMSTKTFLLVRDVDVSGISGTGVVAWGVQFPDGIVVTRWCSSETRQTCVWSSIKDVEKVHGHGGSTRIVWGD